MNIIHKQLQTAKNGWSYSFGNWAGDSQLFTIENQRHDMLSSTLDIGFNMVGPPVSTFSVMHGLPQPGNKLEN